MVFYDKKPSAFEAVGNGSHLYRFNIQEIEIPAENAGSIETSEVAEDGAETSEPKTRTQYQCEEVVVWEPLTSNKVTEAVIAAICPASHEQKLVNEYNAANLGLVGGSKTNEEAKKKIAAYKEFLEYRAEVKERVDADCAEAGIK